MDEFKVKKENVLRAMRQLQRYDQTDDVANLQCLLTDLFPDAFQEEKKEEMAQTKLEKLISWHCEELCYADKVQLREYIIEIAQEEVNNYLNLTLTQLRELKERMETL